MISHREKSALQLAKKVFEQCTHDALPIAREIIAMELELGVTDEPTGQEIPPILKIKKPDEQPINELLNDFPVSDIVSDDPAQPVKQFNKELVCQPQDDFPF